MDTITLSAAGKSEVVIHQFGAHVTSWKNAAGREMIYTSPLAVYDGKKAIRGGIPVCFPQFGKKGPLKQHGFARNMRWSLDSSFAPEDNACTRLFLRDTAETRSSEWPHAFELSLTVSLARNGNSITVKADVKNRNANGTPFTFTMALHTYFSCESEKTILVDFDGLSYEDNVDTSQPDTKRYQTGPVTFEREVDRIFFDTPEHLTIPQEKLTLHKVNMPDAIVWNPHVGKAAALADMPNDDWKHFICIEPARVANAATVAPGDTWTGIMTLTSTS